MEKFNTITNILCAIVIVIAIFFSTVAVCGAIEEASTETIECGACGAHVDNWWYVTNYEKGFIPVCEFCYEHALEEDMESEA